MGNKSPTKQTPEAKKRLTTREAGIEGGDHIETGNGHRDRIRFITSTPIVRQIQLGSRLWMGENKVN